MPLFDWCKPGGTHSDCRRKVQKFYFEGKKLVMLDEFSYCSCTNKNCECGKANK